LDPDGVVIAVGVTNATAWAIVDGDEAIEDETHERVAVRRQRSMLGPLITCDPLIPLLSARLRPTHHCSDSVIR
jgi:hypothetical protein